MLKNKIFNLLVIFSLSIFLCSCDNDSNTATNEDKVSNEAAINEGQKENESDENEVDLDSEQENENTSNADQQDFSQNNKEASDQMSAPASTSSTAIKMAVAPDYYPFEFKKDDEEVGFNVDLAHFIAKNLNRNLVVQDMNFQDLIPALEKGEVDFLMSSITPTIARAENIDFSNVYFSQNLVMLMKSDANETNVLQLSNQAIGVEKGTVFENYIKSKQEVNPTIQVVSYNTVDELIDHLKKGDLNGVLLGEIAANGIKDSSGAMYKISVIDGVKEDYAIAFKKDSELLEQVNNVLNQEIFKQEINKLQQKWFK